MSIEISRPDFINNTIVGYVQEPNGRGTLSVLFSCLLTLSLCVWSAVHLDLPKFDEKELQYAYRYLKWSILGVFGPELIIWAAWRQFISARTLTKMMQEDDAGDKSMTIRPQWTMVHSFYTGMGGFVFDLTSPEIAKGASFIPHRRRLHVTPRGMRLLARCGLLPDITKEDIDDKSKTDEVGKFICCIQVGWFLVQAITRLAVGLPITPLEINTIGHVACALMNYCLWWHKPRWVKEPTILRGDWTRAMCAFMYVSSQVSAEHRAERDVLRNFGVKSELSGLLYISGGAEIPQPNEISSNDTEVVAAQAGPKARIPGDVDIIQPGLESGNNGQQESGRIVARKISECSAQGEWSPDSEKGDPEYAALEEMRQVRWQLVREAIEQHTALQERLKQQESSADELRFREALELYPEMPPSVKKRFKRHDPESGAEKRRESIGLVCASEELVVDRPRNWPGDDLIRRVQGHLMGMIMWLASTMYGAIHLAAWYERFPTPVETWFWRVSAAYLVFSGLLWSALNLLGHLSGSVWWYWYDILAKDVRRRSHIVIYILCCIGGTLYVVARTYLVVEAFISLRALPASTYESPAWILAVPHL